jgi:hypothetical protein
VLPINFVKPREPQVARDPNRRKLALVGALAGLLVVGLIALGWVQIDDRRRQAEKLALQRADLDRQLVQLNEDAARIKAIGDWTGNTIVWLDELYDLTDRFPDTNSLRLTQLQGEPNKDHGPKDKHVGRMSLTVLSTDDQRPADTLIARMVDDGSYRVHAKTINRNLGIDRLRFSQQFTAKVDIEPRPPTKYSRRLPPPKPLPVRRDREIPFDAGALDPAALGLGGEP